MTAITPDPFTEDLCRRDPRAANLHRKLLDGEKAMDRAGWGDDGMLPLPRLFLLYTTPGHDIDIVWTDVLNKPFHGPLAAGVDLEVCLLHLAELLEQLRQQQPGSDGRPAPAVPDGELCPRPPWRCWGLGMATEAWALPDTAATRELAARRGIQTAPDREEIRMLDVITRDGLHWTLGRTRGLDPHVQAYRIGSGGHEPVGVVPHVLSRVLNFWIGAPEVPVVGFAEDTPPAYPDGVAR